MRATDPSSAARHQQSDQHGILNARIGNGTPEIFGPQEAVASHSDGGW
jgi:hypothetical protein